MDSALLKWTAGIAADPKAVSKHQMELYFQQLLSSAIVRALYHLKTGREDLSLEELNHHLELYESLKDSTSPDTQQICARFVMAKAGILMENGGAVPAWGKLTLMLQGMRHLFTELKRRLRTAGANLAHTEGQDPGQAFKVRRCVPSCIKHERRSR